MTQKSLTLSMIAFALFSSMALAQVSNPCDDQTNGCNSLAACAAHVPSDADTVDGFVYRISTQSDGSRIVSCAACGGSAASGDWTFWMNSFVAVGNSITPTWQECGQMVPDVAEGNDHTSGGLPSDNEGPNGGGGSNSNSPLYINKYGFRFSGYEGGTYFDIRADGNPVWLHWITPGTGGLLALDRNGNGSIDDGTELFGDATLQFETDTPNGFEALRYFDFNGDGVIDKEDRVFRRLRVWLDYDVDGLAGTGELVSLSEFGVTSISLDYDHDRYIDPRGNSWRYTSHVEWADGTKDRHIVDVFFPTYDQ